MQVDLWYVRLDDVGGESFMASLRSLLDEGELRHEGRLGLERIRRQHVVTRALVRCVLEGYTGFAARSFQFTNGPHGKPRLVDESRCQWRFNVSHADGAVVCAIAQGIEIGVDIERGDRQVNLELAERYFAPAEVSQLRSHRESDQARRFLEFWTLKEAFIKSLGTGLATPLASFAFRLGDDNNNNNNGGGGARVESLAVELGSPHEWVAGQFILENEYLGAVAVRDPRVRDLRLRIRRCVPLRDHPMPPWRIDP